MRRNISLTIIGLFFFKNGPCQTNNIYYSPGLKFALHFQKQVFSEAGVGFYKLKPHAAFFFINRAWGPNIGVENNFDFNKGKFILGPKIGYEYFFSNAFFEVGTHLIDYTDFNGINDVRLSPEVGLSMFVAYNLAYSYQIKLSANQLGAVSSNKLSLKLNLIGLLNNGLKPFKTNHHL